MFSSPSGVIAGRRPFLIIFNLKSPKKSTCGGLSTPFLNVSALFEVQKISAFGRFQIGHQQGEVSRGIPLIVLPAEMIFASKMMKSLTESILWPNSIKWQLKYYSSKGLLTKFDSCYGVKFSMLGSMHISCIVHASRADTTAHRVQANADRLAALKLKESGCCS